MWSDLADLIRSYTTYWKAKKEAIENPKPTPEGCAAWLTAIGTLGGVILAGVAAVIFWNQLTVMKGQLDEMQAEQRAWIKVDVSPTGPLTWPVTAVSDLGMIPIRFDLENTGHAPAFSVQFTAEPFIPTNAQNDPLVAQRKWCSALGSNALTADRGFTVFPGEKIGATNIPKTYFVRVTSDLLKEVAKNSAGRKTFVVWIVGCATYFEGSPKARHQSGFVYTLGHLVDFPGGAVLSYDFETGINIPIERLRMSLDPAITPTTD